MANKIILVDTSILIDFYRKTDKANSVWISLIRKGYEYSISVVTKYEIYSGAVQGQLAFWDSVLQVISVIPLDEAAVNTAVDINARLKQKRKQIDLADLFIAATAITHKLPLATLNRKHFDRIDELTIIE
ncbi:MAG: type II toxin-antitoxin system VapC family toxin [Chitinophagaceae bacterium]